VTLAAENIEVNRVGVPAWIKSSFSPGIRLALRDLQREIRFNRIHRRAAAKARRDWPSAAKPLKLHLGCGPNHLSGWCNIDLLDPSADYHLDLRRDLPWPAGSVEMIYSEHFVEHIEYPGQLEGFLAECLRVLRPGGRFDAGVPDAEQSLLAYARGDDAFLANERARWHPRWCVTYMDSVNYTFRQGNEHRYAYDFQTLSRRLSDAGFAGVRRRAWEAGQDLPGWEQCLYVTAFKPD
jgi:predicted SAM-dependent methyltransferase